MPLKAQLLQLKLTFSELKRKFGLFGTVGFIVKDVLRQVWVHFESLFSGYKKRREVTWRT